IHNDGIKLEDNTELFERLVTLFEREIKVLKDLPHPHIPRGEDSFRFTLNDDKELYCLVMEKILGQDLEQWLNRHGAIKEEQALDWLQQLTETLDFMHKHEWFHRDIKPSNIIRQPDGTLFLIDFGTVRQITATIIKGGERTSIYSQGYTPPEQRRGQAVPESDFYALGRTFVHLLTGKHPDDIKPDISQWSQNIRHRISDSLVTLINDLMTDTPNNRPQNAQVILARLNQIQNEIKSREQTQRQQWRRWVIRGVTMLPVLLAALLVIHLLRPKNNELKIGDDLSHGEEILANISAPPEKSNGVQQVKDGNYKRAVELLNKAWNKPIKNQPDAETLIYLNNAKIKTQQTPNPKGKVYTIAVVAPLANTPDQQTPDQGLELLRGVAHAQDEAIKNRINLRVLIANDANKPEQAKQIAKELVSKPDILAVVGHHASEVTKAALPTYKEKKLVSVSISTSTSEELKSDYFFRIIPNDSQAAEALAKYLDEAK
ncbi:MAG: bifunctional serine/threonine-protein kinase/ABC transporter substrate-binding protein, partial [Microcystaceae cyanobacterium]